jgi:hypothetical protein
VSHSERYLAELQVWLRRSELAGRIDTGRAWKDDRFVHFDIKLNGIEKKVTVRIAVLPLEPAALVEEAAEAVVSAVLSLEPVAALATDLSSPSVQ